MVNDATACLRQMCLSKAAIVGEMAEPEVGNVVALERITWCGESTRAIVGEIRVTIQDTAKHVAIVAARTFGDHCVRDSDRRVSVIDSADHKSRVPA